QRDRPHPRRGRSARDDAGQVRLGGSLGAAGAVVVSLRPGPRPSGPGHRPGGARPVALRQARGAATADRLAPLPRAGLALVAAVALRPAALSDRLRRAQPPPEPPPPGGGPRGGLDACPR